MVAVAVHEQQILLGEFFEVFECFGLSEVLRVGLRDQVFLALERDATLPPGLQQILEGFRRVGFRYELSVVGDRIGN